MNFPFEMAYLHPIYTTFGYLVSGSRVCHLYLVVEPTHLQSIREIGSPPQRMLLVPTAPLRLILSKLRYHINHINSWLFGTMFLRSTHPSFWGFQHIAKQKLCSKTPATQPNQSLLVSEAQHSSTGVPLSFIVPIRAFPIGSLGLVYLCIQWMVDFDGRFVMIRR